MENPPVQALAARNESLSRAMPPARFQHIERIVIRSANWVGDAIMTTPAVRAIRRNFPAAHISLLAKPWVAPVFALNPDIDEVMVYQAGGRHRSWIGLIRLARDLHSRGFDLAILFQNAFEAALLSFMAGIPRRMGFTTDARTALLTDRIRSWRPLKKGHLIDYYLGLLNGAGLTLHGRRLTLIISPDERREARCFLEHQGIGEGLLIGLNPGATFGTAKRWLPDRFVELGRRLIEEQRAHVLIFGGPDEINLGRWLAADIGEGAINLCGKTTLRQAMSLIGQCNLFVTNDSGLMHVAAALEIPQVAVIGPTDPVATGPVNAASRLVIFPEACEFHPCMQPHCPVADHRCMTAISVERVMQTALTLLERSGSF
jgi:lipopolysaccharide heptosyltransferase II